MYVETINVLVGLVAILGLYFLPSFFGSGTKYSAGIFLLNLLLGWTVLSWIGALVWAVSAPKK